MGKCGREHPMCVCRDYENIPGKSSHLYCTGDVYYALDNRREDPEATKVTIHQKAWLENAK